jgi:hypothetical protein
LVDPGHQPLIKSVTHSAIRGLFIAATVLGVSRLQAASIEYSIEERGNTIQQTANVKENKVQIKAAGGDPGRDMLFDAERQILFVVDHRNRTYTQIDNRTIDEVAALMDSVSTVVGSQQGVLADLLGTLGMDAETEPRAKLFDAGRELQIGDYSCHLFQSHLNSTLQSEICIADNSSLKLSPADFTTLRVFFQFGNRILLRAGKLLTVFGLIVPEMNLEGSTGLPIGLHSAKDQLKVRVIRILAGASTNANYQLPPGYARASIPFITN